MNVMSVEDQVFLKEIVIVSVKNTIVGVFVVVEVF